ncbi:MAG: cysteine desulfurase-like protein [Ornithinimicrobium sp.]
MFDVSAVRAHFPALRSGTAFFDGPGGTQTPTGVATAMSEAMLAGMSNRDRLTATGRRADDIVTSAREAMADLLGAAAEGIIFGRSMTSLTYDLARTLAADWGPQDEIVVTSLDHDANVRPWVQAAQAVGAQVRWAHFDPETAELPVDAVSAVLSPRTRLVALTGASNVLGTKPDVAAVARRAHQQGALVFLDAVHLAPHASIDMVALEVDFVACSPYKFFGPHLGVLAGVPEALASLQPAKLLPSPTRIPERFEVGTLPYEALAGASAAVDFIAELSGASTGTRRERLVESYAAVGAHECQLQTRLEEGLDQLPSVVRYSRARHRTPTVYLRVAGVDGAEVSTACARAGVNAPYSNFYAIEASRRLGLEDEGAIRAGIAAYTTAEDVDRLVAAVRSVAEPAG